MATNTADYYLEATLRAKKDVKVYSNPVNGKLLRDCPVDSIVGKIKSYVQSGGYVWWQLYEGGFVKHEAGAFDPTLAETSSQGFDDKLKKGELSASFGLDSVWISLKSLPTAVLVIGGGLILFFVVLPMFRRR